MKPDLIPSRLDTSFWTSYKVWFVLSFSLILSERLYCECFKQSNPFQQRNSHLFQLGACMDSISNSILVHEVKSSQDILDLADLRYNEWMLESKDINNNNSPPQQPPPPSRYAFRIATMEIVHERTSDGAIAFIAHLTQDNNEFEKYDKIADKMGAVVGAAELSPIELEGAYIANALEKSIYYVTDVVTSSLYRRRGIGEALMKAIETKAIELRANFLILHVECHNIGAYQFYTKLNYEPVVDSEHIQERHVLCLDNRNTAFITGTIYENDKMDNVDITNDTIQVDMNVLAKNAGTLGQILLCKKL